MNCSSETLPAQSPHRLPVPDVAGWLRQSSVSAWIIGAGSDHACLAMVEFNGGLNASIALCKPASPTR